MNSVLVKTVFSLCGLLALTVGIWLALINQKSGLAIDEEVGFIYPKPREIGDFNLIDYDGLQIHADKLRGHWWLVYFGFTYCPDACPLALNDMKKINSLLDDKIKDSLKFLFISVDPGRDTPTRLKEYVTYFNEHFYAATGDPKELEKLATKMGVVFIVPKNPPINDYFVDHSSFMLLLNPQVQLAAIFKAPHDPRSLLEAIEQILEGSD